MGKKKAIKKPDVVQPGCAFCKSKPLTEEHVFSDWIKQVIPRVGSLKYPQFLTEVRRDGKDSFVVQPLIKQHQGYLGNRRVKMVCGECNNGWMSKIEEEAMPVLIPLILGQASILKKQEIHIIAKWAVLKTIVAEYTDLGNKGIPAAERKLFFEEQKPHSNWKIWIGRYIGHIRELRYHHVGSIVYDQNKVFIKPTNPDYRNTQFSIFVIGDLLIYTFKSSIDFYHHNIPHVVGQKVTQIFPNKFSEISWTEVPTLSEDDFQDLRASHINLLPVK